MKAHAHIFGMALVGASLSGCGAFAPSMVGSWTGECIVHTPPTDVIYSLALDLKDDGGEVSGQGSAEIDDPAWGDLEVELEVSGTRKGRDFDFDAVGKEGGKLAMAGSLEGNVAEGDCEVAGDWGHFTLDRKGG
jgi:hypothetical protein